MINTWGGLISISCGWDDLKIIYNHNFEVLRKWNTVQTKNKFNTRISSFITTCYFPWPNIWANFWCKNTSKWHFISKMVILCVPIWLWKGNEKGNGIWIIKRYRYIGTSGTDIFNIRNIVIVQSKHVLYSTVRGNAYHPYFSAIKASF